MAHPGHRHQTGLKAGKPGVDRVVGRAGLAVEVAALELLLRPRGGTDTRDVVEQAVGDVDVARRQRAAVLLLRRCRRRLEQQLARGVGDALDHHRCHRPAAVGQHRVGLGQPHRRGAARAQRQRQVVGLLVGFETVARQPVPRGRQANLAQHPDADQVPGPGQGLTQRDRAIKLAVGVLRRPAIDGLDRRIVDDRGRHHTALQRRRIQKRLDARSWLAPSLGDMVEGLAREIETAHQRTHPSADRVERDKGRLHLGPLRHGPGAGLSARLGRLPDPQDVAALDGQFGRRLGHQPRQRHPQTLAADAQRLARGQLQPQLVRADCQHDGHAQLLVV